MTSMNAGTPKRVRQKGDRTMKRFVFASLFLVAFGCGEPKAPPPGAGKADPLKVEMPSDPAPTENKGAPTESSTEKDSAAGAPKEE
jgi:hypothetical protein